jgi:hypothetical protein
MVRVGKGRENISVLICSQNDNILLFTAKYLLCKINISWQHLSLAMTSELTENNNAKVFKNCYKLKVKLLCQKCLNSPNS